MAGGLVCGKPFARLGSSFVFFGEGGCVSFFAMVLNDTGIVSCCFSTFWGVVQGTNKTKWNATEMMKE